MCAISIVQGRPVSGPTGRRHPGRAAPKPRANQRGADHNVASPDEKPKLHPVRLGKPDFRVELAAGFADAPDRNPH